MGYTPRGKRSRRGSLKSGWLLDLDNGNHARMARIMQLVADLVNTAGSLEPLGLPRSFPENG